MMVALHGWKFRGQFGRRRRVLDVVCCSWLIANDLVCFQSGCGALDSTSE